MADLQSLVAQFPEAIRRITGRTPIASAARTADWEQVALGLRDRAFFSAGITQITTLAKARQLLEEWASLDPAIAFRDRSKFVAAMRQHLGAPAGDSGKLTDIASRRRLELIYNFQTTQAAEHARMVVGSDPDVLDAFPAQELVRIEDRQEPRDWLGTWRAAGGQVYDGGRMIALKDDPIWTRISRFGVPYPPFDFGSGMGLADVERAEAERLGVLTPSDTVTSPAAAHQTRLEASVADLDATGLDQLRDMFGDQVALQSGKAQWQGNIVGELFDRAISEPDHKRSLDLGQASERTVAAAAPVQDLTGWRLHLTADEVRKAIKDHGAPGLIGPGERNPTQRPLSRLDLEMLPHVWRDPDEVRPGKTPGSLEFRKVMLGRTYLVTWTRSANKETMGVKTLWIGPAPSAPMQSP
jgi:hypothetical protein